MPLAFSLKKSKLFFFFMLFILSGALTSIFCSYLPYYMQLLLAALALSYGARLMKMVLLKEQKAIIAFSCREDQTWLLKERSGKEYSAFLCGDTIQSSLVCLLRFKTLRENRIEKISAVVFYDSLDALAYRRLQLRLNTITIHKEDSYGLIWNAENS